MNPLYKKSVELAEYMVKKCGAPTYTMDPLLILTILSVVIGILRIIIVCEPNFQRAYRNLRKPGTIRGYRINRLIRKSFQLHDGLEYPFRMALDNMKTNMSQEEFVELLAEYRKLG